MKRLDRRSFLLLASVGGAGTVLSACGGSKKETPKATTAPVAATEKPKATEAPAATTAPAATDVPAATNTSAAASPEPATPEAVGGTPEGVPGGAVTVTVKALELSFDPKELTIPADTDVTIDFQNTGLLDHDFVIEGTDFGTELIAGGESAQLKVNLPAGDYTYYCTVTGHRQAGMEGTLHVVAEG